MKTHARLKLLLLLYLGASLLYVGYRGAALTWDLLDEPATDFRVFYAAGRTVVGDEREFLYDYAAEEARTVEAREAIGDYFNPPLLALLFTPLTALPLLSAKPLFVGLMATAAAALVVWSRRWSGRPWDTLVTGLAVFSFWPLYNSFQLGQPTAVFALVVMAAFVSLEQHRYTWVAVLAGLLSLKPSVAVAHLGLMGFHGGGRALAATAVGTIGFALRALRLGGARCLPRLPGSPVGVAE